MTSRVTSAMPFAMHQDLDVCGSGESSPSHTRMPYNCWVAAQPSRARVDRGPSQAACRENSKPQWCTLMRLERDDKMQTRSDCGHASSVEINADEVDAQARAFREGARALDELIEGMARSVRLDHLGQGEMSLEDRRLLEQEEERRQHELELRRARRREREARDPHRKVALKLEIRRRFERDQAAHQESIPIRKVEFAGSSGLERVDMVDVGQLRYRCKQLDEGATVKSLLDRQRHMEQQERSERWASTSRASSKSGVGTSGSVLGRSGSAPLLARLPSRGQSSAAVAEEVQGEAVLWAQAAAAAFSKGATRRSKSGLGASAGYVAAARSGTPPRRHQAQQARP